MKNLSLLFIALVLLVSDILSQSPDILWTKTYGGIEWEIGYEVQETSDGGFIISGVTNSFGGGSNDFYLIKTDANGDTLWTKTYGGAGTETAYSVFQTADGGYVIAGKIREVGQTYTDVYIIRTNSSGDTLWTRIYGNGDTDEANSVIQTEGDGYYVMVGNTRSFGPGNSMIYFMEVSPTADTMWQQYYGGSANDYGQEVIETEDGYAIIGSTANFGAGSFDAWIIRVDWDYNIIWSKTIGGSQSDDGYSIKQLTNGDFIGAGRTKSFGQGDFSFLIFRLSSGGDSLWAKVYGGTAKDQCTSVKQALGGGIIAAGSTESFGAGNTDWYIVRTDVNGNSLWTKTIGGIADDECHSVAITSDGGYVLTGSTKSYGSGAADLWLVKLAPDPVGINEEMCDMNYLLFQNYPNPFNPITKIKYKIPERSFVTIKVFDVLGNEVITLLNKEKQAGTYGVEFDATGLTSGVYFFRLQAVPIGRQAGDYVETKKMVLMK
ncbi:MAG: T9SS type A sorting domain-containing protein [Melioribacteraceae bacterium]|nr:T9SS type A sorting domain-containing protein [Melioribacteraceae bacterium]